MSADLLGAFDPFYTDPKQKNGTTNGTTSNAPSTVDDLSFFDQPQPSNPAGVLQSSFHFPSTSTNSHPARAETSKSNQFDNDFDAWGDFESPASPPRSSPKRPRRKAYNGLHINSGHTYASSEANTGRLQRPVPSPNRLRAATQDFFSGKIIEIVERSDPAQRVDIPKPTPFTTVVNRKQNASHTPDPDVLFDADNLSESEDDDFGDFESAPPPQPEPDAQPDLVGLEMSPGMNETTRTILELSLNHDKQRKKPIHQERNLFEKIISSPKPAPESRSSRTQSPFTPWPSYGEPGKKVQARRKSPLKTAPKQPSWDDPIEPIHPKTVAANDDLWDWGEETGPREKAREIKVKPAPTKAPTPAPVDDLDDTWAWDAVDAPAQKQEPSMKRDHSPPTNVPPPSVLMTIFPEVLKSLQPKLLGPGFKNRVFSDPAALDELKSYLSIGVVAAHVVAGRKFRWKRDTILSQSMRIGQAGAGGRSGMKLTGVDKTETAREDRETGDLVCVWNDQVGRLRAAVAIANLAIHDHVEHLVVSEIQETMPVMTATLDEGALTAPKYCVLCGLKREERVFKIDSRVEDSFGEWWVDHWGHRACRDFWLKYSDKLKHR